MHRLRNLWRRTGQKIPWCGWITCAGRQDIPGRRKLQHSGRSSTWYNCRKIDYQMEGKEKMAVSDPMGHHPAKDLRTRTDCQRRTGKSAEQTKASFEERQLRAHLYRQKLSGTMGRNDANCQPRERKALYTGTNLLQNKCTPGYSMRTMRLSESDWTRKNHTPYYPDRSGRLWSDSYSGLW